MKYLFFFLLFTQHSFACDDTAAAYKFCSPQRPLYQKALEAAKAEHKQLLLVFGFESCPWCQSLHKILTAPANKQKMRAFHLQEIEVLNKAVNGAELRNFLVEKYNGTKAEGSPFVVLLNPVSDKAAFFNTDSWEQNTETQKGHDPEKIFAALEKRQAELR